MLTIRWDVLVVAVAIAIMVIYVLVRALFRVNAAMLLDALTHARCDATDEPNLYELYADRRATSERSSSSH